MFKYIISFVCGLLFSLGLTISGMTLPHKVIGFLNVFGAWDITLLFVMAGAILVYSISFIIIKKGEKPLLDSKFHLPIAQKIDKKLFIGAVLFGVGWGLVGLCPGPAITSLSSGSPQILYFVGAMIIGSAVPKLLFR